MSKELFLEERERDTWDYTDMPSYNEVVKNTDTPREQVLQIDKLRDQIQGIQDKIGKLKVLASNNIYAFDNPFGLPLGVCIEMINSPQTPYFYVSPTIKSEYIKRPGYHGEEYRLKTCVRNPVFDWNGQNGKTLKNQERKFYDQ